MSAEQTKLIEQRDCLLAAFGPLLARAERSQAIIDSHHGPWDLQENQMQGDPSAEILNARAAIKAATP